MTEETTEDKNTAKARSVRMRSSRLFVSMVILLIILLVVAFWFIRDSRVKGILAEEQIKISRIIQNTIRNQANLDLLQPDIVFIGVDSTNKKTLDDSVITQISRVLAKKYINNNPIKYNDLDITPYFVNANKPDKNGKYTLTEKQLTEVKNHIVFLTAKINEAVSETRDEINKEIGRVNTLVSIWIGVIAILGVFVPILINVWSRDELKEMRQASKDIEGIKREIATIKKNAEQADTNSKEALDKSQKTEGLFYLLNAISMLYLFEPNYVRLIDEPIEVLKGLLGKIHEKLKKCELLFDYTQMRDCFSQLALRLHSISYLGFIGTPHSMQLLNVFSESIEKALEEKMTIDVFKKLLEEFDHLIKNIK